MVPLCGHDPLWAGPPKHGYGRSHSKNEKKRLKQWTSIIDTHDQGQWAFANGTRPYFVEPGKIGRHVSLPMNLHIGEMNELTHFHLLARAISPHSLHPVTPTPYIKPVHFAGSIILSPTLPSFFLFPPFSSLSLHIAIHPSHCYGFCFLGI